MSKVTTDAQQSAMGKTVKFGLGQITNPTPKWAKAIFRIISFATGLWAIAQQMDLGLSQELVSKINSYCVGIVPAVHFAIKFFGWDYKDE